MWAIVCRVFVPFVLLVAGIASAVYGVKHHVVPVVQEREEEISIPITSPFGPGPGELAIPGGPPFSENPPLPGGSPIPEGPPVGDEMPPGLPFAPWQPPAQFVKAIKKTIVTTDDPEPRLIREASVGGLMLADSGEIKRTYSGDEGPSLCPT